MVTVVCEGVGGSKVWCGGLAVSEHIILCHRTQQSTTTGNNSQFIKQCQSIV